MIKTYLVLFQISNSARPQPKFFKLVFASRWVVLTAAILYYNLIKENGIPDFKKSFDKVLV